MLGFNRLRFGLVLTQPTGENPGIPGYGNL